MTLSLAVLNVWILWILVGLLLIICVILLRFDIRNRVKSPSQNIYEKWINGFSLLVMILCIIRLIIEFLYNVASICEYINPIYEPIQHFIHLFLTFYQISRFFYCFKSQHSIKTFIFLYINGVLWIIYTVTYMQFILDVVVVIDKQLSFCMVIPSDQHRRNILLGIAFIWYQIWDMSILFMYCYKIYKLKQTAIQYQWKETQFSVPFSELIAFCKKTLILYLIISFSNAMWWIIIWVNLSIIFGRYSSCFHTIILFICIFLMMEHNKTIYHNFICVIHGLFKCKYRTNFPTEKPMKKTINGNQLFLVINTTTECNCE